MQSVTARIIRVAPCLLLLAAGCQGKGSGGASTTPAAPAPKPSPSATPFPLTVNAAGLETTLFDEKGNRIAQIKAATASAGPAANGKSDPIGTMTAGTATLYEDNRPTATFSADQLRADRDAHRLIGTGNVTAHSLRPDGSSVRADRMTWLYEKNRIVGEGNVLITRNPDLRAPGARFEADTAIEKFTLYGSGAPITGSY